MARDVAQTPLHLFICYDRPDPQFLVYSAGFDASGHHTGGAGNRQCSVPRRRKAGRTQACPGVAWGLG